ncbi:Ferritin/ribonucleotide reductase-like protein [Pseudohyphozyma bogoriensis]|nr:Ferritin/ribonucleotide reductase-like protein [Pseudohyphozyma bogoriensis]
MKFGASLLALAAVASLTTAVPVSEANELALMKRNIIDRISSRSQLRKRQSITTGADDATVLNFALILEHLEASFYSEALAKFNESSFASAGFSGGYALLQGISSDEAEHVSFLTSALTAAGATPVQACNYSFPYTDVPSFLALSQILEGVGTSAYLGAATSISTPAYLTAAGSILTVEARHSAFIRYLNGYSPFPSPNDTPQSASSVVTMATPFFASCPSGSAPTIEGHPALTLGTSAPTVGANITLSITNSSAVSLPSGTVYCGFASYVASHQLAGFVPTSNVTAGQTYVVLTTNQSVSDASVLAGPQIFNLGDKITAVALGTAAGGSGAGASGTTSGAGATSTNTMSGAGHLTASVVGGLAALAGAVALAM